MTKVVKGFQKCRHPAELYDISSATNAMQRDIDETNRRRDRQEAFNVENGIEPRTIIRAINDSLATILKADYADLTDELSPTAEELAFNTEAELDTYIAS